MSAQTGLGVAAALLHLPSKLHLETKLRRNQKLGKFLYSFPRTYKLERQDIMKMHTVCDSEQISVQSIIHPMVSNKQFQTIATPCFLQILFLRLYPSLGRDLQPRSTVLFHL